LRGWSSVVIPCRNCENNCSIMWMIHRCQEINQGLVNCHFACVFCCGLRIACRYRQSRREAFSGLLLGPWTHALLYKLHVYIWLLTADVLLPYWCYGMSHRTGILNKSANLRFMQSGRLSSTEGAFVSNDVVPLSRRSVRELNFVQGVSLRQPHCWPTPHTLNFENMSDALQTGQREETCRICLESSPIANSSAGSMSRFTDVEDEDRLISPCACSGTWSSIHLETMSRLTFAFLSLCFVPTDVCFSSFSSSSSHILSWKFLHLHHDVVISPFASNTPYIIFPLFAVFQILFLIHIVDNTVSVWEHVKLSHFQFPLWFPLRLDSSAAYLSAFVELT
jgi:hypothetical protein